MLLMTYQFKSILVTGGAGFIGSNFLNKYVKAFSETKWVNLDKLTYAGNLANIEVSDLSNYEFIQGDICDETLVNSIFEKYQFDGIIHFAAESHVDFSISDPAIFIKTNVLGTEVLLRNAKKYGVKRFHHISTDEVYGQLGETGYFTEESPIKPSSPYSATKASSDLIVKAYYHTFNLDITITNCSNNYGPYQDLSKLIPKFTTNLLTGKHVPLYKDGKNIRDWLYVEDHCDAIWKVFTEAKNGETYNVGGNSEKTNMEITKVLLAATDRDESFIDYVADRPGHDFRYAIDASKIKKELGWEPKYTFEEGIKKTIEFYKSKI